MIAFLFSAAVVASAATPCGLKSLDTCRNTNALVWAKDFEPALKAFLGNARGSYIGDNRLVSNQVEEALGGPPDAPHQLPSGDWLFTACQPHECGVKGAVVIDKTGTIEAVGLISYDCHHVPFGQSQCERSPELTIFVQRASGATQRPFYQALVDWAEKKTSQDQTSLGVTGPFQGIELRGLLDERDYALKYGAKPNP